MSERTALVLTALPLEQHAVRYELSDVAEHVATSGTRYLAGRLERPTGGRWRVLVAMTRPGNVEAGIEAERALSEFRPDVALFVGIAGGLKDVKVGDVVVSSEVAYYEPGKAATDYMTRVSSHRASYRLLQWALSLCDRGGWQPDDGYSALVGKIASGEKVLAAARSVDRDRLSLVLSDALAAETEGWGLASASWRRQCDWLVIRGISDMADEAKGDDPQPLAARNAARFAVELLRTLPVGRFKDRSEAVVGILDEASVERDQLLLDGLRGRLPQHFLESTALADVAARITKDRFVALVAPPGAGKTTVICAIAAPTLAKSAGVAPGLLHAAVTLGAVSDDLDLAVRLARQLAKTVAGFESDDLLGRMKTLQQESPLSLLLDRLRKMPAGQPVRIAIDGIDEAFPGGDWVGLPPLIEELYRVVGEVLGDEELSHVCFLLAMRPTLQPPTGFAVVPGGFDGSSLGGGDEIGDRLPWLSNSAPGHPEAPLVALDSEVAAMLLAVLRAAGPGRDFPIQLFESATGVDRASATRAVKDLDRAGLAHVVSDQRPGSVLIRLSHPLVLDWLDAVRLPTVDRFDGDSIILDGLASLAPMQRWPSDDQIARYARTMEPVHHLSVGSAKGVVDSLRLRQLAAPRLSAQQWPSWIERIEEKFGVSAWSVVARACQISDGGALSERSEETLARLISMRESLSTLADVPGSARFVLDYLVAEWTGKVGAGPLAALKKFDALLDADVPGDVLDFDLLNARHEAAFWQGMAGEPRIAIERLNALLPELASVLGMRHPITLYATHNKAFFAGRMGDAVAALEQFRDLLSVELEVLGPDHPETLQCRHEIAYWTAEVYGPHPSLELFAELEPDRERVQGPGHTRTCRTRYHIARLSLMSGDRERARLAYSRLLESCTGLSGRSGPEERALHAQLTSTDDAVERDSWEPWHGW